VEFDGVEKLLLSRLMDVGRQDIRIGMSVKAEFRRKATWSVRNVYSVRTNE
jgi:uncharacterized OB-fold protein